jgi:hypothetical protein
MSNKTALSVVLLLVFSLSALAQDPAPSGDADLKKARRAKIIDAIVRDAGELRLPENRAFVSAKLGSLIAKEDPERASALFKSAVADLMAAQGIAENNKNPIQQNYDLLNSQSLRPSILSTIAAADAEFALGSLYRTRPSNVQKALSHASGNTKINNASSNYAQLAQQEINLEQRLIRVLADQKPERSVAFLKESIKKNLSGETLELLKKVLSKDPAVANELANEVVDRLVSKSFVNANNQANFDLLGLANSLLGEFMRERRPEDKFIAFSESGIRSLAGKLLSTYIERGGAIGYIPLEQLEPIARRFSPGTYELLKKAAATTQSFGHRGGLSPGPYDENFTKLIRSNPTAEALITEAKKFPPETRRAMYLSAANKLSDADQYERAVALLNDNFEDDAWRMRSEV